MIPFDPPTLAGLSARIRHAGEGPAGAFAFNLDLSSPFLATAIHAGYRVRSEVAALMAISEKERRIEEDTATDRIIQDCPSTLWVLDSRAEYDLNRPPEQALPLTPDQFWGKRVFKVHPGETLNRRSLEKHEAFYRFAASVIRCLLDRFGACVIYDFHSYNIARQVGKGRRSPPLFNLGTEGIDRVKWEKPVAAWLDRLRQIRLPRHSVTVAENDVFGGRGEFCRRLSRWDSNILVLPTEISKVYMDEHSGIVHKETVDALKKEIAPAVADHATLFQRLYG